jgi:hypothetical protein
VVRQPVDLGELPIDALGELERIQPGAEVPQRSELFGVGLAGTRLDALERRARRVIAALEAGSDAPFLDELHRRQKHVLQ